MLVLIVLGSVRIFAELAGSYSQRCRKPGWRGASAFGFLELAVSEHDFLEVVRKAVISKTFFARHLPMSDLLAACPAKIQPGWRAHSSRQWSQRPPDQGVFSVLEARCDGCQTGSVNRTVSHILMTNYICLFPTPQLILSQQRRSTSATGYAHDTHHFTDPNFLTSFGQPQDNSASPGCHTVTDILIH